MEEFFENARHGGAETDLGRIAINISGRNALATAAALDSLKTLTPRRINKYQGAGLSDSAFWKRTEQQIRELLNG